MTQVPVPRELPAAVAATAVPLAPEGFPLVAKNLLLRRLGRVAYEPVWQAMKDFTNSRTPETPDELWLVEHPPVYTLGQAGKPEHLLSDNGIPLVKIDRGGQITYHGPGQPVVYLLVDLTRRKIKVRELVTKIEQAVIDLLAQHGLAARRLDKAPGVYVGTTECPQKIAALGLRIRNGRSYHGVSLNVEMDLAPFLAINPCGYAGMVVTQTRDQGVSLSPEQAGEALVVQLVRQLDTKLDTPLVTKPAAPAGSANE